MICPKCGGNDVTVQAVSITGTKNHGIIWWLFVSWWIWIVWLIAFIPMALISLITKKTATKTHTEAVCQSCGNRWKVK